MSVEKSILSKYSYLSGPNEHHERLSKINGRISNSDEFNRKLKLHNSQLNLYKLSETQINKYGTTLSLPPVYKIPNNPSDKLAYINNLKINNANFESIRETLNHMINFF